MANQIWRNLGRSLYSQSSLRVMRQNLDYNNKHRPNLGIVKVVVGLTLIEVVSDRVGYDDWLAARRKENSPEVRLEIRKKCESTIARLEKMDREMEAIKKKQKQAK